MKVVLDTDSVLAGMRSPSGASAAILRLARQGRVTPLAGALGLPILAASTGLVGQSPAGVQIVAGRYREDLCLRAGEAIEARGTPPLGCDSLCTSHYNTTRNVYDQNCGEYVSVCDNGDIYEMGCEGAEFSCGDGSSLCGQYSCWNSE